MAFMSDEERDEYCENVLQKFNTVKKEKSKMTVEPVNSWVLVEPLETTDKVGSLYVVTKTESYKQGKIVALPYSLDEKVQHLRIGNVIVYDSLGAVTVRLGQGTATLVKTVEILCVVRED